MGTVVNGTTTLVDKTLDLSNLQSVKERGEVSLTMGGPKDGDNVKIILRWNPMVIAFSSGEGGEGHIKVRDELISDLEAYDIKLTSELHQLTSYYMKPKSNSSKLLTALIMGIPIVTLEFSKAIKKAFEETSEEKNIELDFYKNFPNAEDYLPDPAMKVNLARKNLFEGKTFIFPQQKERDALLATITSGGGKALVYESLSANEPPVRIKNFVLSKVRSIDDVILVGYHITSPDKSNQEDIEKLLVMNEAAKLLGVRLFAASDLLKIILNADPSGLTLRRAVVDTTRSIELRNSTDVGSSSFLETSVRLESEDKKPKPNRRRKFQPKQLDIMELMTTGTKRSNTPEKEASGGSNEMGAVNDQSSKPEERIVSKESLNPVPPPPLIRRRRPEKISDDQLVPINTVAPDVTENAREYKRRRLLNKNDNDKIPNEDSGMFDISSAPGLVNDDDGPDEDSGEPVEENRTGFVKWGANSEDEDDDEQDEDLADFGNLAIVEATLPFRESRPQPVVITHSGRPNYKRFRVRGPRPPRSIDVGYIEAAPTNVLLEQDLAMFRDTKQQNLGNRRGGSELDKAIQRPSKRSKKAVVEESMFVNSDDSDSEGDYNAIGDGTISSVTENSRWGTNEKVADDDDDDEFTFRFTNE